MLSIAVKARKEWRCGSSFIEKRSYPILFTSFKFEIVLRLGNSENNENQNFQISLAFTSATLPPVRFIWSVSKRHLEQHRQKLYRIERENIPMRWNSRKWSLMWYSTALSNDSKNHFVISSTADQKKWPNDEENLWNVLWQNQWIRSVPCCVCREKNFDGACH